MIIYFPLICLQWFMFIRAYAELYFQSHFANMDLN